MGLGPGEAVPSEGCTVAIPAIVQAATSAVDIADAGPTNVGTRSDPRAWHLWGAAVTRILG